MTVVTAATVTMTSCKNEATNDERVEVKFASASAVQTRVSGDQWEGAERIGVYMLVNGTTTIAESAENILYTTSSTDATGTPTSFPNATASFSSTTPVHYPVNGSNVDFIAYHPHQSPLSTDWIYQVDVGNQSNQSGIDLMWTGVVDNGSAGYNKTTTPGVNLPFTHKLVKLELNVVNGQGIADFSGLAVSIKGMNTTADFDVESGSLSNAGVPAAITPWKNALSYNYEAILLPVSTLSSSHKIEFTVGGNTYTWALSGAGGITGASLDAGKKYSYTVTVKKYTVSVTGTITNWSLVSGTGTAD